MIRLLSLLSVLVMLGGTAWAAEGRVPFPSIPKANGEDVHKGVSIRTEHMNLLLHQRDETMRKGIRPKEENLQSCLSCHAVKDKDGHAVSYESPEHFCRACHDYAAVKVDCFECHSSTPDATVAKGIGQ